MQHESGKPQHRWRMLLPFPLSAVPMNIHYGLHQRRAL
jgi:hypothetical protein